MDINPNEMIDRAKRLLGTFFTGKTETERIALLAGAFASFVHDPRSGLDTGGSAEQFASACVDHLVQFGCVDGHRHALSCLLTHLRETGFGTHPPSDFVDLPPLLDQGCALPSRDDERTYLQRLIMDCRAKAAKYASLQAVAKRTVAPAARCDLDDPDDIAIVRHLRRRPAPGEQRPIPTTDYPNAIEAIAAVPRAALLGQPGGGKSTTLRRLASEKAAAALDNPDASLPLLVNLGLWVGEKPFAGFLADQLPGIGGAASALARAGRLLLLLDGLNEIPVAQRAAKGPALRRWLQDLGRETSILVCCRSEDYRESLDLGLDTLTLQPLSPRRVREVLIHWCRRSDPEHGEARALRLFWQLAGDPALAGVLDTWLAAGVDEDLFWSAEYIPGYSPNINRKTSATEDALWHRHVRDPRALLRLAANPFMLTMLYRVWIDGGERLPRNRGDLFARFIDALLAREGLIRYDAYSDTEHRDARADLLLDGLASVAWTMQGERHKWDYVLWHDFGVLTVLSRDAVIRLLGEAPPVCGADLLKLAEDATLLEDSDGVRFRHPLLLEVGNGVRFRHQLLQEYFAAVALKQHLVVGGLDVDQLWPRYRWWERSGWEEAAHLLAGLYSDDCTPVIRWLKDMQPEVTAGCVLNSGAAIADPPALHRELHDAWMPRLTNLDTDPRPAARAALGRALGLLNLDDRRDVGLRSDGLPEIDWVEIPGGEFVYQHSEQRTCETFRIARYPVTHRQFQAFLDDPDGYARDRWWRGLTEPDRQPGQASSPITNHPCETVNWFEAVAFCAWLSERLGQRIRLPTEWEWERAARGTEGSIYPWGSEWAEGLANTWESGIGRSTAVGLFPGGCSLEGVHDLVGNVSEWCLNEYYSSDRIALDGIESRVLRGGSWRYDLVVARADYRSSRPPGDRDGHYGFRLLLCSPIR